MVPKCGPCKRDSIWNLIQRKKFLTIALRIRSMLLARKFTRIGQKEKILSAHSDQSSILSTRSRLKSMRKLHGKLRKSERNLKELWLISILESLISNTNGESHQLQTSLNSPQECHRCHNSSCHSIASFNHHHPWTSSWVTCQECQECHTWICQDSGEIWLTSSVSKKLLQKMIL